MTSSWPASNACEIDDLVIKECIIDKAIRDTQILNICSWILLWWELPGNSGCCIRQVSNVKNWCPISEALKILNSRAILKVWLLPESHKNVEHNMCGTHQIAMVSMPQPMLTESSKVPDPAILKSWRTPAEMRWIFKMVLVYWDAKPKTRGSWCLMLKSGKSRMLSRAEHLMKI